MLTNQVPVTFGQTGNLYPLTAAYVASNPIQIPQGKYATVYAYYKPGTGGVGNKLNYQIETNPCPSDTGPSQLLQPPFTPDPNNTNWSPAGIYTDSSGNNSPEVSTFLSAAGVALTQQNLPPVVLSNLSAAQIRIKAQESVAAGSAGTVQFFIMLNTIN